MKSEDAERFESYAHAKEALVDYIEVFYNQRRRNSTFGQISPAEFERRGVINSSTRSDHAQIVISGPPG